MRKDIKTVMHEAGSADFVNHIYTTVYASSATTGLIINGNTVNLAVGSEIDLLISSVGGTLTNVYLLGYNKNISNVPGVFRG